MPTYETPQPISLALDLSVGNVRITAGDRTDTSVEVRPSDAAAESDMKAAAQVRVDYANGVLQVTGPKARLFDFSRKTKSVEVSIELPSDSQVSAEIQAGDILCAGRLGECRFKTSIGNVRLGHTGPLRLHTGAGHVSADVITGDADISTGTGKLRLGDIEGAAVIKNSNGDTTIEMVNGDVRVRSANGAISIKRSRAAVDAKTSNGGIRLGEVTHGSVILATAAGDVEVGIAEGTAAWLEVHTGFGHVHNLLEATPRPGNVDKTVEVRARTSYGDITIHRPGSTSGWGVSGSR